jgi:hypothetical protein
VAAIVTRVVGSQERGRDLFANLQRIGIDEISYRKGQRYLTVVVDHDSGHLVWAEPGRYRALQPGHVARPGGQLFLADRLQHPPQPVASLGYCGVVELETRGHGRTLLCRTRT